MPVHADDVRRMALELPATTEKLAWGMPTFRVKGKIFVWLGEDDASMGMKCPTEDRAELIAAEPHKFFLRDGHDDTGNWIRVRLAAVDDHDELRAMIVDAWRLTAPARLAAEHDLTPPRP
jgi:hypothetical protein